MIYRDFNHWWSEGKHGYTSASREYAKEIWDDLEETMKASADDAKLAYLALATERAEDRSKLVNALFDYIKAHAQPGQPKFWRWYMERETNE